MDSEKPASAARRDTPASRRRAGRPTRVQSKQRDLELLETALDLFMEHGFERTSIDSITAAVGMAKRTVYQRYGNKTRLFKASLQRAIEEWILPVEKLRAAETNDLEQTLLRIGKMLTSNVLSRAGLRLMRITNAESVRMPEIGEFTYIQGTGPTLEYLADLLVRRVRSNGLEIADPQQAAICFMNITVAGPASMTAWGIKLAPEALERHTRFGVHAFLHGLLHAAKADARSRTSESTALVAQMSASPSESKQVKDLTEENHRLKVMLANSMLEIERLRESGRP